MREWQAVKALSPPIHGKKKKWGKMVSSINPQVGNKFTVIKLLMYDLLLANTHTTQSTNVS